MSLDGIVTRALTEELKNKLLQGRIGKIYQPENDEIIINIYNKGENYRLLLSANSSNPRIHFTNIEKENPQEPPMFCMVLRKHLSGGNVLNIEQYGMDRVISIDISALDELGLPTKKKLIIEIMGRHSNVILVDGDSNKIIDSIIKVSMDMSRVRQVLPGLEYTFPPSQNKLNPLDLTSSLFNKTMKNSPESQEIFKFFYMNFTGMSPLVSREICFRSQVDPKKPLASIEKFELNRLYDNFASLVKAIEKGEYRYTLIEKEERGYQAFYVFDLKQYNHLRSIEENSISIVLDKFYSENDQVNRIHQKSLSLKKSIQTKLDRAKNKLSKQKDELLESQDREKYKIYADLISANFHNIEGRGQESVVVQNFYSTDMESIEIPLDPRFDANRNAQRYYKKYSRLKNGEKLLKRQIPETKSEINYLEHIILGIENSTNSADLEEIRDELISEGYIRGKKRKSNKKSKAKPHHYLSSEGYHIYVGKNNRQNDQLTMKFANKDDIWLHVQNMPGSHVLIRNDKNTISKKVIEEAAMLAAFYSSARQSSNVPVDYTEKKNVNKPGGAKAGMVIYEDFHTVFVTPSKDFIDDLEKI